MTRPTSILIIPVCWLPSVSYRCWVFCFRISMLCAFCRSVHLKIAQAQRTQLGSFTIQCPDFQKKRLSEPSAAWPKRREGSAVSRRVEAPKAPSGVGMGRDATPQPTKGPAGNAFWCILKATERSFLHIYIYVDALSSSNSVSCHICGQGRGFLRGNSCRPPQRKTAPAYGELIRPT